MNGPTFLIFLILSIPALIGFVIGYGVREWISRRRHQCYGGSRF
jgi:hypothetical protein